MEVKILSKIKPAQVRSLSPSRCVDLYQDQLSSGGINYVYGLKEANVFLSEYRLKFSIKERGVWFDNEIVIPKGAILDGSSVPAIARAIINDDYHNGAWEPHDGGYTSEGQEVNINGFEIPALSRKTWDFLFTEIVKQNGAPKFEYKSAHLVLRLGGWGVWNKEAHPERFLTITP